MKKRRRRRFSNGKILTFGSLHLLQISEHEHGARFDAYAHFAALGDVGQAAGIRGGEQQVIKRIFEVVRAIHDGVAAEGQNGNRIALLRGQVEFSAHEIQVQAVLLRACGHAEVGREAHDGKIAKRVVVSAAEHAVKNYLVRAQNFLGVIHGKFAVPRVFVGVVFDDLALEILWFGRRIEVAEQNVGRDGAPKVAAVATYHLVRAYFALYLFAAIQNYSNFHVSNYSRARGTCQSPRRERRNCPTRFEKSG